MSMMADDLITHGVERIAKKNQQRRHQYRSQTKASGNIFPFTILSVGKKRNKKRACDARTAWNQRVAFLAELPFSEEKSNRDEFMTRGSVIVQHRIDHDVSANNEDCFDFEQGAECDVDDLNDEETNKVEYVQSESESGIV